MPQSKDNAVRFNVRVQPRASGNQVAGMQNGILRIRLQAPPVDGAANEALIAFLADQLGVRKDQVRIVSGFGSRNKIVEVDPDAQPALNRIFASTGSPGARSRDG